MRTLYQTGKTAQLTKEMRRLNLTILGVCETRWTNYGKNTLSSGETIIYSGKVGDNVPHANGVAIVMNKQATSSLIEYEPVSDRIITARFDAKYRKLTIIQVYAPTNEAPIEEKDEFYNQLETSLVKASKRDIKIIMGDLNAKVGNDNMEREDIMGKHGVGTINENGELLTEFCQNNSLVIGGTIFPHKECHKTTWLSPDGHTNNQIDHFMLSKKWRTSLLDVRTKRSADIGSDHELLFAVVRLKLAKNHITKATRKRYIM